MESNAPRIETDNVAARDSILASIRASLSASVPFDAEHQKHHREVRPIESGRNDLGVARVDLLANFQTSLELVGGKFTLTESVENAQECVLAILAESGANTVAISDSELVAKVLGDGTAVHFIANATKTELFDCDLGITSAQWAIAETGTLVLESDRESSRLTSLVPPKHLCIVRASSVRQSLAEILSMVSRDLSRTITFITGASRTSDIELTLAIGVHGPAELHVVMIGNE